MNDTEDVDAYILNSTYRSRVLEHLAGTNRATPKEIADSIDASRPHVSRALSELQDKGVVELRVSEARTVGRYYGLTEKGTQAWPRIQRALRNVEWTIQEPATPRTRSVLETAQDEFCEELRCVGTYDEAEVTIWYLDPDVRAEYSDEEFEDAIRTLIFDHSIRELSISGNDCYSEVLHFQDRTVLRVRIPDGSQITISFSEPQNVSVPEFTDTIQSIFEH